MSVALARFNTRRQILTDKVHFTRLFAMNGKKTRQ